MIHQNCKIVSVYRYKTTFRQSSHIYVSYMLLIHNSIKTHAYHIENQCYLKVIKVQLNLNFTHRGVGIGPAGLVLAGPLFLKVKIKFHFTKSK